MAIDLKNLIDQVLGMARDSMDMKKRKFAMEDLSGNDLTQQRNYEIQKELNKQHGQMEQTRLEGRNRLAERELTNAGDLEKQRLADAGALARQGLANEATRYTADQGLQGHMYTADTNYAMKRDELNKGYDPELIKAHAAVIANVNSSPEAVASSQAAIDWYTQNAMKKKQQARQGLAEEAPAAIPATQTAKRPAWTYDDGKDNPVTPTVSTGGKSMEFRQEGIISPEQYELNKKKSRERLLYGTKPQQKSWFGF